MTDQPIPGTLGVGFAVDDDAEDPNLRRVSIEDLFRLEIEYVVVPPEALPQTFIDRVCELAVKFAGALGVQTPQIAFFAQPVPSPVWLACLDAVARARRTFSESPRLGWVSAGNLNRIWINVGAPHLEATIAHEVAHTAGYDEDSAREVAANLTRKQEENPDAQD